MFLYFSLYGDGRVGMVSSSKVDEKNIREITNLYSSGMTQYKSPNPFIEYCFIQNNVKPGLHVNELAVRITRLEESKYGDTIVIFKQDESNIEKSEMISDIIDIGFEQAIR